MNTDWTEKSYAHINEHEGPAANTNRQSQQGYQDWCDLAVPRDSLPDIDQLTALHVLYVVMIKRCHSLNAILVPGKIQDIFLAAISSSN